MCCHIRAEQRFLFPSPAFQGLRVYMCESSTMAGKMEEEGTPLEKLVGHLYLSSLICKLLEFRVPGGKRLHTQAGVLMKGIIYTVWTGLRKPPRDGKVSTSHWPNPKRNQGEISPFRWSMKASLPGPRTTWRRGKNWLGKGDYSAHVISEL